MRERTPWNILNPLFSKNSLSLGLTERVKKINAFVQKRNLDLTYTLLATQCYKSDQRQ